MSRHKERDLTQDIEELLELTPPLKPRQHSIKLDTLVVVKVDVVVDQRPRLTDCFGFVEANTFRFKNAEEVFNHCVVVAIAAS